jgi:uncharacterized lipoprotein YehR (DUF1307 family)
MKVIKYIENLGPIQNRLATFAGFAVIGSVLLVSGVAAADQTTTKSATATTNQHQSLQTIISKGDNAISQRLTTLGTLTSKINATTKLSDDNKNILSNEVSTTISGLNELKTKLDADTSVATASTDAASIFTVYRVYALVVPKIGLVSVADNQQVIQGKLSTLATKLQSRITAAGQAGKDVTSLQTELTDMTSKTNAAQAISSNIESSVISLQPADYNSNHSVLTGDNTQLKTAQADDQVATTDATSIASGLKSK